MSYDSATQGDPVSPHLDAWVESRETQMNCTPLARRALFFALAALPIAAHAQTTCTSTLTYTPQNPVFPQPITVTIVTTDSVTPPYDSDYLGNYYANEAGDPMQGKQSVFGAPGSFSFTFTPFAPGSVSVGFSGQAMDPNPVCGEYIGVGTTIQVGPAVAPPTYNGLNGQYAFAFKGLNPQIKGASSRLAAIGSFTADGLGHITAGTEDVNSGAGSSTLVPITGSYIIDAAGNGVLKIASSFGVQQLSFFVPTQELAQPNGPVPQITGLQLFSTDGYVVFGNGSLQLQKVPEATPSELGAYSLSLSGYQPCSTTCNGGAAVFESGSLSFDAAPGGPHGTLSGSIGAMLLPSSPVGDTEFAGIDPVTGRFTFTLSQGQLAPLHFAGYALDGLHLLLLSTDSHRSTYLLSGTAIQQ